MMTYDSDRLRNAMGRIVIDNSGSSWELNDLAQEIKRLEHEWERYQERTVELDLELDDLKFRLARALKEIERLQSLILPDVIREVHP